MKLRRLFDTFVAAAVALCLLGLVPKRRVSNCNIADDDSNKSNKREIVRTCLLACFCFTYGCEVAFKCANRDVIFLVNECHVLTAIHILILGLMPFGNSVVRPLVGMVVPLTWGPIGHRL